jgi:hypothetical protein
MERFQRFMGHWYLGDKETKPTGYTAESEAIATTRPGI